MSTSGPLDAVPTTKHSNELKSTGIQDHSPTIYGQGFMDSIKKVVDGMYNDTAKSMIDACPLDFSEVAKEGKGTTGGSARTLREETPSYPKTPRDVQAEGKPPEKTDERRKDAEKAAQRLRDSDEGPVNPFKMPPIDLNVFERRGPMDPLPGPLPKNLERINQRADDIVSRIKDDGFGSEPTRTEVRRMMEQAARGDYLPELIEAINKKLKEKGSDTELQLDTQSHIEDAVWRECDPTYRQDTHTVKLNRAGQSSDEIEFRNSVKIGKSPCDSFRYRTPSGKWISSPLQPFTIPDGR